jgi:ElaB/YqjD/DUF883 family membrane-anchored ribosome-binding protein
MSADMTNPSAGNNWSQSGGAAKKNVQPVQDRVDALKDKVGDALDRGKSGIAESAHAAGDSLSNDVAMLREAMAAIQATLSKFASEAGGEALKTAQNVGSAVGSQVGDAASEMASAAKAQAKTLATELENVTRNNPLATIGATLLVGVIIGMISRKGRA